MEKGSIIGFVAVLGIAYVATLIVHWFVVGPELHRHGYHPSRGFAFWWTLEDLRKYKELITIKGRSLTFYYLEYLLVWFTLMLAAAIAIQIFWEYTHPVPWEVPR